MKNTGTETDYKTMFFDLIGKYEPNYWLWKQLYLVLVNCGRH